jgi:GR25 family glycosyltransferase involved in LPS biosynthesis
MVKIAIEDIYVINLESSKKRLRDFKEQVESIKMPYKIWPAVDGRNLTKEEFRDIGASIWALNTYTKKRQGELGCYFSHTSLWEHIKPSKKNSGVMIFEDDIKLSETFYSDLVKLVDSVPEDWDVLLLGFGNPIFFSKPSGSIRKMKHFWGTYAYILRTSSIPKLLPYVRFAGEPIDTILDNLGSRNIITIYAPENPIVFTGGEKSTIRP